MKSQPDSRTRSGFRNSVFSVASYIFTIICSFIVRTIFILNLNSEYLGINGLFTNILSLLSLAELGIANAIIFYLYKPLAEQNKQRIQEIITFFRVAYRIIAGAVFVIGLLLLPFLNTLIKNAPEIEESIYVIYLLFLLNSVVSYLFIYKKSLLVADQKEYQIMIVGSIFTFCLSIAQIIILVTTHNFLLFIIVQIVSTMLQNLVISKVCDKKYSYIKSNKATLSKEVRKSIFRDVRALAIYRIASIVTNSTDTLILSRFVGIVSVGIYSNYYLIIHSVYSLIRRSLTSLAASIGNLNVFEDIEKKRLVYNTVNFAASWLFGLCGIIFYVVLNPFIIWWIGEEYIFDDKIVLVLLVNFYLMGISGIYNVLRNTFGLFVEGQLRPIVSSIINLVCSLVFVHYYGVFGVFFGTTIAFLSINVWFDPYIVYKHGLKRSIRPFYMKSILYAVVIIATAWFLKNISGQFNLWNDTAEIVLKFVMCFISVNCIFLILYWRTEELQYVSKVIRKKLSNYKNQIQRN